MNSGICDPGGLMLYSLFLLGNSYCYLHSEVLKSTIMDREYNCTNYTFGMENWWNVNTEIEWYDW